MKDILLDAKPSYQDTYELSLLYPIPRSLGRGEIGIKGEISFHGIDIWNCYELSWLNTKGKPQILMLQMIVPCSTEAIVESKSLKLYFNSFNNSKFADESEVVDVISKDINKLLGGGIIISKMSSIEQGAMEGESIDDLDIECNEYRINKKLLKTGIDAGNVSETLHSNLLKCNCLVTNQPDWGSVQISYRGAKIDHDSLLRYIVSYRNHNEFAEQCAERMFTDIMEQCQPEFLRVYLRFTRRGGIDINPIRSTEEVKEFINHKTCRQ